MCYVITVFTRLMAPRRPILHTRVIYTHTRGYNRYVYVHCVYGMSVLTVFVLFSRPPMRQRSRGKKKRPRNVPQLGLHNVYCAFLRLLWTPPEIINDFYFNIHMILRFSWKSEKFHIFKLPMLRVTPAEVKRLFEKNRNLLHTNSVVEAVV